MKRRTWIIGLAVVGGIGWYAFRPELLFVRTSVNEGLPVAAAQPAGRSAEPNAVLVRGEFKSIAHETRGRASIYRLADLDLGKYRAVTIWCRRFSVNFGTAPLTPAS
jgi:hypothetical protein